MQCPSPISIQRPKGSGVTDRISVPCGVCVFCLSNKRNDWTFRINQELKYAKSGHFVTLTYSDEKLTYGEYTSPTLVKDDLQRFFKRLRKYQEKVIRESDLFNKLPKLALKWKIRYYAIGEYGTIFGRPHYHILLFNALPLTITYLDNIWGNGIVHVGKVESGSIHYTTGYFLTKQIYAPGVLPPFTLMSTKPGIGAKYVDITKSYHQKIQEFSVRSDQGFNQKMPRYYKNKIFNKYEIDKHNKKAMEVSDTFEAKVKQNIENLGNNYYSYKNQQTADAIKSINKKVTKTKKL